MTLSQARDRIIQLSVKSRLTSAEAEEAGAIYSKYASDSDISLVVRLRIWKMDIA